MHISDSEMFLFLPLGSDRTMESAQLRERHTPVSKDTRMQLVKGTFPRQLKHRAVVYGGRIAALHFSMTSSVFARDLSVLIFPSFHR